MTLRPFRADLRRKPAGFVLLEVLISLTILAVTVGAILRSFTQSLSAVRHLEVETKAAMFAQQLLDEFETKQPAEGDSHGGFGEDYWEYTYDLRVEYEYPEYDDRNRMKEIEQFAPLRVITIEINFDNKVNKPFRAIKVESAIMGFERYSAEARRQMREY